MSRAIQLDVTRLLLWLGVALVCLTFRSPYSAADSLAKGELQALTLVRALATCAAGIEAINQPGDPAARARFLAALHRRCQEAGLPQQAWPEFIHTPTATSVAPIPTGLQDHDALDLLLGSEDWLFALTVTPQLPGARSLDPTTPSDAQREAWAWPRREAERFSTAFCVRAGQTLYARNLTRRYLGEARSPLPGGARPRSSDRPDEFWGIDGQYWRLHRD